MCADGKYGKRGGGSHIGRGLCGFGNGGYIVSQNGRQSIYREGWEFILVKRNWRFPYGRRVVDFGRYVSLIGNYRFVIEPLGTLPNGVQLLGVKCRNTSVRLCVIIASCLICSPITLKKTDGNQVHRTVATALIDSIGFGTEVGKRCFILNIVEYLFISVKEGVEGLGSGVKAHLGVFCTEEESGGIKRIFVKIRKDLMHTLF